MLVVKKSILFFFCLSCFLFPGQNWLEVAEASIPPETVRPFDKYITAADIPVNKTDGADVYLQNISAKAVLVLDAGSMMSLWQKNKSLKLFPASTVKIMTGLVALGKYDSDQYLLVDDDYEDGQTMKLEKGELISVKNLLYGLLVSSANDAAMVLAKNYPGGETAFIRAMNQKAAELKLENTHFANPTGLDSDEEKKILPDFSYSTAQDLAGLSLVAMKNSDFTRIVGTPSIDVTDSLGKISHNLINLNLLLGKIPGVLGIKTGWTEEAGECLVSLVERNNRRILIVLLGSKDRFGETEKLINWVFENYEWKSFTPAI